jgi:hypothetical protein
MRRLLLVLSVAALMAAMLVASALPAFAQAGEDASCVGQILSETATGSTGFPPGTVGRTVSTAAQTLDPGLVGLVFSVTAQLPREEC